MPFALGALVYVSVPFAATAGCALKSALLSFVAVNVTAWPDSFAGPALIDVAHPEIVCALGGRGLAPVADRLLRFPIPA